MPSEELTAVNGDVELRGTLVTPDGAGPHPVILGVHAASHGLRDARLLRHLQDALPPAGIAVLTYDRRGEGESTGDAEMATFEEKASDARAWLDLLHEHPAIDPERVGIHGHSQGGWIGPLAAAGRDDVALMAFFAACGITPGEQMTYGYGWQIRDAGYSEEDVERGMELRRFVDRYWRGEGVSREEAIAAMDEASAEPWYPIAPPPDPRDPTAETWPEEMDLDIRPTIAQLRPMSILLLFGVRDRWIPSEESAARWREALPPEAEVTYETIPGTTHFPTPDHDGEGPLHPRYEEALVGWLRERFGLGEAAG